MVGSQSDADLKNSLSPSVPEIGQLRNIGLQLIAPLCLGIESALIQVLKIELFSAGSPIPEVMDILFIAFHVHPMQLLLVGAASI